MTAATTRGPGKLERGRECLALAQEVAAEQAADLALWGLTVPDQLYVQRALRRLHAAVAGEKWASGEVEWESIDEVTRREQKERSTR